MKNLYVFLKVITISLCAFSVQAADFEEAEVYRENIKVSSDGTGVIKNPACSGCDVRLVSVTENTKVFLRGQELGVNAALRLSKAPVAVIHFSLDTKEVLTIRFGE